MTRFDVGIIGAGIGGLVCGCYLAKAGLKVLIVEQHNRAGGCCTSFERGGFRFDVGVHYLGSLREGGVMYEILKDLDILERIKFIRNDPTDRIITPDRTLFIRKDKEETRKEFIAHFPEEEENINAFYKFVLENDFLSILAKTKNKTFKELLDDFFTDYKLKAILSVLLGNIGLPPSQASALVATVIFEEFIFDGGYYPRGGIQVLPDILARRFQELGGKLLLSTKAVKIITKNRRVIGIKTERGDFFTAKFVVSNSDATSTFKKLLDSDSRERKKVGKLKPSSSAFVLYLGLDRALADIPRHYTSWIFFTYNIEKCYNNKDIFNDSELNYILCSFPSLVDPTIAPKDKSIARVFVGAEYAKEKLWEGYKDKVYKKVMKRLTTILPDVHKQIEVKVIGTPFTFSRFTGNRDGALFGWSAIPAQIDRQVFPTRTSIGNLYLAGHWVTHGIGQSGVAVVAFSGKYTAKAILNKLKER